ncbi:MAG: DUF977 family protein [Candidatus Altarchaeaceae archaeon]
MKISDNEKNKIIEFVKEHGKVTIKDVMNMFNVSKFPARNAIIDLVKSGKLIAVGRRNKKEFILSKEQ